LTKSFQIIGLSPIESMTRIDTLLSVSEGG